MLLVNDRNGECNREQAECAIVKKLTKKTELPGQKLCRMSSSRSRKYIIQDKTKWRESLCIISYHIMSY